MLRLGWRIALPSLFAASGARAQTDAAQPNDAPAAAEERTEPDAAEPAAVPDEAEAAPEPHDSEPAPPRQPETAAPASPVDRSAATAPSAVQPTAPPDAEADASPADSAASSVELVLGIEAFSRNFEYEDAIPQLPEYSLGSAPGLFIAARVYPLAHVSSGPAGNLGISAGFEQAVAPPKSSAPGGRELEASSRSFFAGLHARIPLDRHELGLDAGYGQHSFELSGDEDAPLVPDVHYRFVRAGLDARFRIDRFVFGLQVGRRFVIDSGEIQSEIWFPHLDAGGVDAGLNAGMELASGVELLLGVELRRYFFDMNPNGADRILSERGAIAGGAVDQYLSGWIGLGWRTPAP